MRHSKVWKKTDFADADTKRLKKPLLASRNLIRIKHLGVAGFDSTPSGWF
jgi:hypothetical protein